jgi:glycine cleavage system aminomethyltransferase T
VFGITPSARLRPSPFYEATLKDGVTAFTTYNHMLMPTSYGHPEEEYWRIINGVSQWDVAVERQVQLKGQDAGRLVQILSPRKLATVKAGQGKYVPLCNHRGVLINDPILLPTSGSGRVQSRPSEDLTSRSASRMFRRWPFRARRPKTWSLPSAATG